MTDPGLTPAEQAVRETALFQVRRMAVQYKARKWTPAQAHEYVTAIANAAVTDIEAVVEGVEAAIAATEGNFPPTPADTARAVARARQRHRRAEIDAHNEARRQTMPRRGDNAWCGYLARAAVIAHLADIGQRIEPHEQLRPYLDLVTELGYRNANGCGEWTDAEGRLHAADPHHNPWLYEQAIEGAKAIWEGQGRPAAPTPAQLVNA